METFCCSVKHTKVERPAPVGGALVCRYFNWVSMPKITITRFKLFTSLQLGKVKCNRKVNNEFQSPIFCEISLKLWIFIRQFVKKSEILNYKGAEHRPLLYQKKCPLIGFCKTVLVINTCYEREGLQFSTDFILLLLEGPGSMLIFLCKCVFKYVALTDCFHNLTVICTQILTCHFQSRHLSISTESNVWILYITVKLDGTLQIVSSSILN